MDPNISVVSFSEFNASFGEGVIASTPQRTPVARRSVINFSKRKSPGGKRISGPTSTCKDCGKNYVSTRAYKNHIRLHSIEKLARYQPSQENVMNNIHAIDKEVLEKCYSLPQVGPWAKEFSSLVMAVQSASEGDSWTDFRRKICQILVSSTVNASILLPSHLAFTLVQCANQLLCCSDSRRNLTELLRAIQPQYSSVTLQHFISEYTLHFTQLLLKFFSTSVRGGCPRPANKKTVQIDSEDEQIIFYCGGAVLRGFLNMGRRHSSNAAWRRIVTCIHSKLLENGDAQRASLHQRTWTEKMCRGGLLKINAKALKFFIEVTKACAESEQEDGSLPYDSVINAVLCGDAASVWDDLVNDALSPRQSVNFMYGVVRSFSQTCGNGIARRRVNRTMGQKASASINLRHRVAPK